MRLEMRHFNRAVSNHSGFSIAGALVGTVFLALVVSGAGSLIASTKSVELQSARSSDIDQAHLATLQKARNLKFLKTSLGLADPNNALAKCLGYYGTNCRDFSDGYRTVPGSATSTSCVGDCTVTSSISYKGVCSDTNCTHITIVAETEITMTTEGSFKNRHSEFAVPGIFLVEKYEINFRCAGLNNMKGINLGTFSAECSTNANTGCAGMPMDNFNPFNVNDPTRCKSVVQQSCPAGTVLREAGLFPGQASCAPI